MTTASVIFVDDDPDIRPLMEQTLELEDIPVACFADGASALQEVHPDFEGIVLCDYNMPGMDGLDVLQRIRQIDEDIPVILLTGQGDISTAVSAMQQGAYDFIEKPFDHEELIELLRHALEKRHLALENRRLKAQLRHLARPGPRMLGDSPAMQRVMATIDPVLDISANVLLHGETGSGKDALARYIHENSPRSSHNFVAINCGAVPENLIESELFGHEAGAFTGADKRRVGKIEHAHRGTLFLDELESMPMPLQIKLLRVLEEQRVERLGSNQVVDVDVREVLVVQVVQQVGLRATAGVPVVTIQQHPDPRICAGPGFNGSAQFEHLWNGVDEGVAKGVAQGFGADEFQAQADFVLSEQCGQKTQAPWLRFVFSERAVNLIVHDVGGLSRLRFANRDARF